MAVIWNLSLSANSANEVTKINEYAKELNKKYNLELSTGEYGGLEFFDWGFCYIDGNIDNIKAAEEMIDKVVAHFPDMKLTFQGSGDGPCHQWEKRSKSGVLVDVEPWRVGVHCQKESFDELLTHIPFIKQQGFDVSCEQGEKALYWEYDHITEEDICNGTIVELSKRMPLSTIYSFKRIMMDNVPEIETFCAMKNGQGEWLRDLSFEGLVEYKDGLLKPIWTILKDPEGCFEQLLDKTRRGEQTNGASVYTTLSYSDNKRLTRWLAHLKPEDKRWLIEEEQTLYDCIVLAGMHHNWNAGSGNTSLFEYNAEDEKLLLEKLTDSWHYCSFGDCKTYISLLKLAEVDYKSMLQNYLDTIKPYRDESDEQIQWLRKEIDNN